MFCALINWSSELVAVVSNLCLQSTSSLRSRSQSAKTHARLLQTTHRIEWCCFVSDCRYLIMFFNTHIWTGRAVIAVTMIILDRLLRILTPEQKHQHFRASEHQSRFSFVHLSIKLDQQASCDCFLPFSTPLAVFTGYFCGVCLQQKLISAVHETKKASGEKALLSNVSQTCHITVPLD